ncbi:efflux RND transporter periplasmic adaptor subunit [Tabrizicola oligotrophica]|uniref:Efflux RND transporter periplasmic adaptor subunit n=1 Tax=Tabrizicola oligotrophica TaxID=2710650 RepID=A0A6M0QP94_9RHOB|nr:efflux RND transporter periplasmic adaptor subunit [Tabrizicola oligotrophica]NEY89308.1 efflux RND transporter periplasmic adaptor subunit [Tabrizicola oligotrophica]
MRRSLALLLTLAAQPLWAEAATPDAAQTIPAPHITVATVETRPLRDVIIASGLIGAVEQVQVAPLVEGQPIEELLADVGDQVQAGQVLARLSTSTLTLQKAQLNASLAAARAAVPQAEAQADEAVRVATRTETLLKQGTASQANADKANATAISATQALEAARANLALVEAQLANVDLMLARTEVKAPVAGEITARTAQVGTIASAAQPMFAMIRDNALELRADVAEGDVLRLAPGQPVTLQLAGDRTTRKGTVRLVEPAIDTATRMGRVRITIDEAEGVRPGMYAMAEILVAELTATAAPITALGISPEGPIVLKVSGDTARQITVQTGIRDAGWVEISAGLQPGDRIVAKAGAFVRDGDRITPVAAKE